MNDSVDLPRGYSMIIGSCPNCKQVVIFRGKTLEDVRRIGREANWTCPKCLSIPVEPEEQHDTHEELS